MKTKYVVITAVIILLAIFWLSFGNRGGSENIKIGGVFALSGLGSSQGEQELKGAKLAVDEINMAGGINGRKLELIAEDVSLDKLKVAPTVTSKLIDIDKVTAIVGTTWEEPAQIVVPLANSAKIPMVGPNQTREIEKENDMPFFFSTWHDDEIAVRTLLSHAKQKGFKRIAIIKPISIGYYEYVARKVEKHAKEFGVEIVSEISANDIAITDFRTHLIKSNQSRPDTILVIVSSFTECTLLKQKDELGIKAPIISTEAARDYVSLANCPKNMESIEFSYPKVSSSYSDFEKRYVSAYGKKPETPSVMTAYDAVMIIAEGLKKTKGEGGDKLRLAIESINNYKGVSQDNISFDKYGFIITPPDSFEMMSVRDGKFITIE